MYKGSKILLGSLSIILFCGFMAQLFMARNMLERSKDVLSRDWSRDLKWV